MNKINKKILVFVILISMNLFLQTKIFAQQLEEYVPEVIIQAKWHKVKEKLVPHEGDPWGGVISCGVEIYGEFRSGLTSFGYWNYSIVPIPVMPRSITIDEKDNLYILDPANLRILKFDKDGKYLETINLERVRPKKGQLARFEVVGGYFLEGGEEIYIDQKSNINIIAQNIRAEREGLKFSKTGRFIGTTTPSLKERGYFISKIQSPDKGIIQVIDQKKNVKKEILVNLNPILAEKGYSLEMIEVIKKDKKGNLYIKTIAQKPKTYKYIEQIYKYNPEGRLVFSFKEKENYDYGYQGQPFPTTVATDNGVVYDLIMESKIKEEKKEYVYKDLELSNKRIKEIEDIERFLKQMEECGKKDKKITLRIVEGGFEFYEVFKVIKWQKKR